MNYVLGPDDIFGPTLRFLRRAFVACQENGYEPLVTKSRVIWYAAVLLLAVKIITIALVLPLPRNIFFADITKAQLLTFLNQDRKNLGLTPLAENATLDAVAAMKAQDMLQKQYFSHNSPDGTTPWYWFSRAKYAYTYAGENLAVGFFESRDVYEAWLNSPSHKANLLNPNYTEIGTSVVSGFGGNGAILVVQVFGNPKPKIVATTLPSPKPQVPSPKPEQLQPAPQENTPTEKVLAEQSENLVLSQGYENNGHGTQVNKILMLIMYNSKTLQYLLFALLAATVACLVLNINSLYLNRKNFMLRSFTLIIIVSIAIMLEESFATQFIPSHILL